MEASLHKKCRKEKSAANRSEDASDEHASTHAHTDGQVENIMSSAASEWAAEA